MGASEKRMTLLFRLSLGLTIVTAGLTVVDCGPAGGFGFMG